MRKSALALAALFALTGAALAENPNVGSSQTDTKAPVSVDLNTTGSIHDGTSTVKQEPKLGYNGNPWILPNAH